VSRGALIHIRRNNGGDITASAMASHAKGCMTGQAIVYDTFGSITLITSTKCCQGVGGTIVQQFGRCVSAGLPAWIRRYLETFV
jgi:hypothetical protein